GDARQRDSSRSRRHPRRRQTAAVPHTVGPVRHHFFAQRDRKYRSASAWLPLVPTAPGWPRGRRQWVGWRVVYLLVLPVIEQRQGRAGQRIVLVPLHANSQLPEVHAAGGERRKRRFTALHGGSRGVVEQMQ